MKRWIKRCACFAGGAVVFFTIAVLAERVRGQWSLSSRLKSLATHGEVLSLERLTPKRPAADQNVFADLLALTNQLETLASNLDFAPPSLRLSAPSRAVAVVNVDEWSNDRKTTNNWKSFDLGLRQAQETLTTLESAVQKPAYDGGIDYEKGFVDFQLKPIILVKRSSQLLSWSVLNNLKQGRLDAAHKDLSALVMLTAKQSPEPIIICQLVRLACAAFAFNTTWQALQVEGWNDAQLASLQSEWRRCDFVQDMGFAMEMERAMTLDFYSQIAQSKEKLNFVIGQHLKTEEMSDGAFGKLPTHGFVLNWLHLPVWRTAWLAQDELASLEQWDFMIEHERIARTNGWAALAAIGDEPKLHWRLAPEAKDRLGWYDRMRFLFASENFSITDVLVRRALERQTEQQMAVTVLGIRRYKLRNGRLPIALSELIPGYLAVMPHDFMDGKALHYRVRPGREDFELYSVGEDGKDNGGDPDQNKDKKSYRQIWDGRDALWPSAATAAESKLAVSTTKHE